MLYFPKQGKKEFYAGSDIYSIWCIPTFPNQAFLDQVMTSWKSVPQVACHPPVQVAYHLNFTNLLVFFLLSLENSNYVVWVDCVCEVPFISWAFCFHENGHLGFGVLLVISEILPELFSIIFFFVFVLLFSFIIFKLLV